MGVSVEPVSYGGWPNNLRLTNGDVELVVTLDVGPRVLRYARPGGPNAFGEIPSDLGGAGETTWRLRGGHRLWVSPEDPLRTYVPDNGPVDAVRTEHGVRLTTPADPVFHLEKTLELELAPAGPRVTARHSVRNLSSAPAELAVWALTVLARNGTAIVPLPRRAAHPSLGPPTAADFAPSYTLSVWPYFTFDDPRVAFGRRFLRIKQDPTRSSTKLGLAHHLGWAGYWNDGLLFTKRFGFSEGARYPDGGCNFECYTDTTILELESLSPLASLAPGEAVLHEERWALDVDVPAPVDEDAIAAGVAARAEAHGSP